MPKQSCKGLNAPLTAPFNYFGGKRQIAPTVWRLLGNPRTYIEPFAGGLAVLLARPLPLAGHALEIVNDYDGMIVNVWRSIRNAPEQIARYIDRPDAEADLVACNNYLVEQAPRIRELVLSHPDACDPQAAAYWIYLARTPKGISSWSCQRAIKMMKPWDTRRTNYQAIVVDRPEDITRAAFDKPLVALLYRLAVRLRYVKIYCGDWTRCFYGNSWRRGSSEDFVVGIYMDPPYADKNRDVVYAHDDFDVAYKAMEWCLEHGNDPNIRIVFSCYDEFIRPPWCERLAEAGWRIMQWKASGGLGNMAKKSRNLNRHREILYISPHCLPIPEAMPIDPRV